MTVVCHDPEGKASVYTKGAPDHVLNRCTRVYKNNRVIPLDLKTRNELLAANERMAAKALRVLAVAYKSIEDGDIPDEELEQDLIFVGLLGMADPPRPGVAEAVAKCRQAGVKVVMVTGDHPATACAIAGQLGLLREGLILTGRELDRMSDGELLSVIDRVDVCSRTTPEHKLRIVKAFKHRGHVVAMTGDGVNDAPAVKEANIGIAMGRKGTDITREAADITLTDDNFATIVTAVEEGRTVGDNIRKSMRYVLAGNFGEVLAIFLAAVSGLPMPLIPSQILWVNLVTESVPAMALGADPPEPGVMS
ncbi:HAD family hydrolase, partial [bacterium]